MDSNKIYKVLYSCCSKDGLRPVMNGIYHDDGKLVATNGLILVCMTFQYSPDLEGKIIGRDGEEISGRYPNYRHVIEQAEKGKDIKDYIGSFPNLFQAAKNIQAIKSDSGKPTGVIFIGADFKYCSLSSKLLSTAVKVFEALKGQPTEILSTFFYEPILFKSDNCKVIISPQSGDWEGQGNERKPSPCSEDNEHFSISKALEYVPKKPEKSKSWYEK